MQKFKRKTDILYLYKFPELILIGWSFLGILDVNLVGRHHENALAAKVVFPAKSLGFPTQKVVNFEIHIFQGQHVNV